MAKVAMELNEAYWLGRHAFEVGFIAAKIHADDDIDIAEAKASALAGLVDNGPAFAHIFGVTIRTPETDAYETDEVCDASAACPKCGNRWKDGLAWSEDGEDLTCEECGTTYTPGEQEG